MKYQVIQNEVNIANAGHRRALCLLSNWFGKTVHGKGNLLVDYLRRGYDNQYFTSRGSSSACKLRDFEVVGKRIENLLLLQNQRCFHFLRPSWSYPVSHFHCIPNQHWGFPHSFRLNVSNLILKKTEFLTCIHVTFLTLLFSWCVWCDIHMNFFSHGDSSRGILLW